MSPAAVRPAARPCPGCHGVPCSAEWFARDPDGHFEKPLRLVECVTCHLVYLESAMDLEKLYFVDYYGKRRGIPSLIFDPFNRWWVSRKAKKFIRNLNGKSVLDFGCGRGDFLSALEGLGYEVWGIEPQQDVANTLRARWGPHVAQRLDELGCPPASLDGITLWHVLEHVDNPGVILVALKKLTKADGKLFIAVPNWDSWERRLCGDRWFHLDVPRHQLQFTRETLSDQLTKSGWKIVSMSSRGWTYNLFGLFQSLLNLGPGPRNFFYRVCKRGVFMPITNFSFWVGALWNLLAIGPAGVATLVLIGPLTAMQKTGTIEVVASV